jgi:D-glycero-D-manno-heptose 1,7-bisphosphate phosphatase
MRPATPRRRAVFLDRDGTLVHDEGYMSRPEQLRPIRNAAAGVKRFIAMGFVPVVVTNQSGVSRGYFTARALDRMHRRLKALFRERGVRFDAIYACPHRDEDRCACRKPKPGLLQRAARELGLDLRRSVMIGDSDRDILAGRAAGAITICVGDPGASRPDYVASDVVDAARWMEDRGASSRGRAMRD